MKNICIPENLFYDLVLYHLCDMDSLSDQIKKELNLVVNGKLHDHLATLNEQARERLQTIIRQMQEVEGVTEDAKMTEPMEWVRKMNSIRNRAEEIILVEMIYT